MIVIKSGKNEYVDGVMIKEGDQRTADEFNSKQDPNAKYWMHAQVIELGNEIEIHSRPEEDEWKPKLIPPTLNTIEVITVRDLEVWGMWKYGISENAWHDLYWCPHNGFLQFFEDVLPYHTFEYTDNPKTMTEKYMNEFFEDYPNLDGEVKVMLE